MEHFWLNVLNQWKVRFISTYLPITLITQGCKLVWINIYSSWPCINQQNSDVTDHIRTEFNSGYHIPKTKITFTISLDFLTSKLQIHLRLTCETRFWRSLLSPMWIQATASRDHTDSHLYKCADYRSLHTRWGWADYFLLSNSDYGFNYLPFLVKQWHDDKQANTQSTAKYIKIITTNSNKHFIIQFISLEHNRLNAQVWNVYGKECSKVPREPRICLTKIW